MRKTYLLFFLFLFFEIGNVLGQVPKKVFGVVLSHEDNLPVIGASVLVKGTSVGTVTDIDGKFTLTKLPSDAKTLVVSYIGMKRQEVPISSGEIKVILKSDAEELQEVVVTGMQKMDKRLFTGATSKLDANSVKMDGIPDVSRALEGRAAGVSVQNVSGTFGTAPKIRVRGATSIFGSSRPLWVVDGVIMDGVADVGADDLSSGDAMTLISSAISGLNADDIESFQILKDGSATSIYGAKAMAGVIVITTKRGKSGTNRISYSGEFSYRLKPNYRNFNIMNSQEQMRVFREMDNDGLLNFSKIYRMPHSGVYGKMYHLIDHYDGENFGVINTTKGREEYLSKAEYRNTDWFDELFTNNISQNHAVSMSTGTEKASYYMSLSMMSDPGWTIQSKVKRYTGNINALYHLSKKLSLNLISNSSYRKQKAPGTLSAQTDVIAGSVSRGFDINPYSFALNTSRTLSADEYYVRNYAPFNIKHELNHNNIELNVTDLRFQGELKYKPIRKVELAALAAYKYSVTNQSHRIHENSNFAMAYRAMGDATIRRANPLLYRDPAHLNSLPVSVLPEGGFYNENKYTITMNSWDVRATASYNDVYNEKHIVNVFAGMEINSLNRFRSGFDGIGMQYEMGMLPATNYLYFKQSNEINNNYFFAAENRSRDASFFGTATYSYNGIYTVNGTIRYEGSNKLGKSRSSRWLPTWNISGAWNMHEEKWFKKIQPAVSNLTLKASYSLTADRGPASVSNSTMIVSSYNPWRPYNNAKESALKVRQLENSELTYEKKHEFNIGAEAGFLSNRINVELDWYRRNNYDLIGPVNTTGVGGEITKLANVASMRSHGIEFTLSTKNIQTKKFQWSSDFIFSKTKNTVTELNNIMNIMGLISGNGFALPGYPVRSLFSMKFVGLNEEGLPMIVNQDGQTTVENIWFQSRNREFLKYEGPTDPTVTGSFGNIFSYKGFRLNLFMTYSFGNVIRLDRAFNSMYSDLNAMPKEFLNRWVVQGDEKKTDIPVVPDKRLLMKYHNLSRGYNAYNFSDVRVAKGDFIRMKEISLGYTFPKKWIAPLQLSNLSMKLQATNLFLIYSDKKLNGQDPEFMNAGGVAVPIPRQFTFTIKLGI